MAFESLSAEENGKRFSTSGKVINQICNIFCVSIKKLILYFQVYIFLSYPKYRGGYGFNGKVKWEGSIGLFDAYGNG